MGREENDEDVGAVEAAAGDLVAHQKGIVDPGRVGQHHGHGELRQTEIQLRLAGEGGIGAEAAVLEPGIGARPRADIGLQHLGRHAVVAVRAPEEPAIGQPEPGLRAGLHLLRLPQQDPAVEAGQHFFGERPHPRIALHDLLPGGLVEEAEAGAPGRIARQVDAQVGDRRGPGVHVRGQKPRRPDEGVEERGLARLHLPDHRHPRRPAVEPQPQPQPLEGRAGLAPRGLLEIRDDPAKGRDPGPLQRADLHARPRLRLDRRGGGRTVGRPAGRPAPR